MTKREVAEALGVTRERVQAMVRQGQLQAESRTTEFGTNYLWFDPDQVWALREERARRTAGERPKGIPGPAPKERTGE